MVRKEKMVLLADVVTLAFKVNRAILVLKEQLVTRELEENMEQLVLKASKDLLVNRVLLENMVTLVRRVPEV